MKSTMKETAGKIEKLFKEDKRFFGFYADFLNEQGDKNKAFKVLKENINLFTDYSTGELVLGEMFFGQKKFDQAEMLFRGALKKDKTCVKAMKYLSELEEAKGNKTAQFELLNEMIKYDPFDRDAQNFMRLNKKYDPAPEEIIELADMSTPVEIVSNVIPQAPQEEKVKIDVKEKSKNFDPNEYFDKIDSSDDIAVPDIPFDTEEDVLKKHKFSNEVLNKEKSFSEDITESLDTLTQNFITESRVADVKPKVTDYSDIIKVKSEVKPEVISQAKTDDRNDIDLNYQDKDPKIQKILEELHLPAKDYKEKMMSLSEYLSEDPEDYDRQINFAKAKFKFAAASVKKELMYYSKKIKEEPKNEKYTQILKTYREELLKLDRDLIEQLNRLKNLYY